EGSALGRGGAGGGAPGQQTRTRRSRRGLYEGAPVDRCANHVLLPAISFLLLAFNVNSTLWHLTGYCLALARRYRSRFPSKVTRRKMAGGDLTPLRLTRRTFRDRQRAPRMKPTAARGRQRTGYLSLQNDALLAAQPRRDRLRFGRQQCLRIGVQRLHHERLRGTKLNELAEIHHRHAIADVGDNT